MSVTSTITLGVDRIASRRRQKAHKLIADLSAQLEDVADEMLDALAEVVAQELYRRETR